MKKIERLTKNSRSWAVLSRGPVPFEIRETSILVKNVDFSVHLNYNFSLSGYDFRRFFVPQSTADALRETPPQPRARNSLQQAKCVLSARRKSTSVSACASCGWSAACRSARLAERSGLNVNTFSLIENSKTSPSVSTLQQIAAALEVPITAFFQTNASKSSIAYITAQHRPRAAFAHGTLADFGAGLTNRAVEPFLVTLEPQHGQRPTTDRPYRLRVCFLLARTTHLHDRCCHAYRVESGRQPVVRIAPATLLAEQ